ncbi:MAG: phosphoribosylformylglycinamidine synthase subunit PurS [Gloeomargaritaceae cyanobacterium C42_A2020_066]|nr:phosphoribosylformylglycinamidine synthase subunit PurS [Gloeomargaritaceae cyanobacterium C42_A2020_066]
MRLSFHVRVYITLRPSVLDPAGAAVTRNLQHLGYGVAEVRIGKYVEFTLEAMSETDATAQVEALCDQVLTNPVVETYRYDLLPAPVSAQS